MADMPGAELQEESLSAIRKSQETIIETVRTWVGTVQSISPRLPSVQVLLADKLPRPEEVVASAYDFDEALLASQRKFAEEVARAPTVQLPGDADGAWRETSCHITLGGWPGSDPCRRRLLYLASAYYMHQRRANGRKGAGQWKQADCRLHPAARQHAWGSEVSRSRYACSGALRIAYELRGTLYRRRPWLVLVQGMGFDRLGWQPVLGRLGRRFRLVLMDNRGSGRSDRPAGPFAVADMVGDVVAVLDAVGVHRAHVLGASLGGMVAQELAITHPDRVDGLVLACTTPGWPFAYPMPAATVRLIAATADMTAEAAVRRHTENALSARTVQHRPELVDRLVRLQESRPAGMGILSAQASAGARYAGQLRQARIRARTLIVHGDADTVVDPRNARLLAERIPDAQLVTFPGLGHLLFWEDPGGFADAVASFLLGDVRVGKRAPGIGSKIRRARSPADEALRCEGPYPTGSSGLAALGAPGQGKSVFSRPGCRVR